MNPELATRLDQANGRMAPFRRNEISHFAQDHEAPHEIEARYFKHFKGGTVRDFRFLIQDFVAPDDKQAILFVDFVDSDIAGFVERVDPNHSLRNKVRTHNEENNRMM